MNNYVIYIHTNKFNNKRYVGMTINTERRWRNDGIEYKPSSERNQRPFWNAIEKYGWENFEHEIVEEHLTFEEACEKEKYYIELYNTRDRNFGYNVAEGGNGGKIYKDHPKGMSGKKHSEEWRRKHSERMKGKNNPAYGRTWGNDGPNTFNKVKRENYDHPKGMLGKKHTEETKRRITETLKNGKFCCKPVKVIYPDGNEVVFDSIKECANYFNLTSSSKAIRRLIQTGEPYEIKWKNGYTKNLEVLVGLRIVRIDNTEVTYETKAS